MAGRCLDVLGSITHTLSTWLVRGCFPSLIRLPRGRAQLAIDDCGLYYDTPPAVHPLALVELMLERPSDLLRMEEAAVLWQERQSLVQDGRALIKLLRAEQAYGAFAEGIDRTGLLDMWATADCSLTTLQAMKLLGR